MQNNLTPQKQSDDLDLLQLIRMVWAGKRLVIACVIVALLIAAAYLFLLAQPRYAIRVYVTPPPASSLESLNRGRATAGIAPYTPQQVFDVFSARLLSDSVTQKFVRATLKYPDSTQLSSSTLNANAWRVEVVKPDAKRQNLYRIRILAASPEEAQRHLTLLLDLAQTEALSSLLAQAHHAVSQRMNELASSMAIQRAVALKQRQDRIAQLREALVIAEASAQEPTQSSGHIANAEALNATPEGRELYSRNPQSLRAELKVLEARENDDPFIRDLREKETRLSMLRAIDPATDTALLYDIDGETLSPDSPEEPNQKRVFALALLLGAIVGALWALLLGLLRSQRPAP
ncbi:hypothetical protein H0484_09355 [Pusillimonas sp. CC-YST705]|uniref:Polysaccharide chain length determinant N-terminal domain-containing protein n=1 Tax=Mesopusillimonas faecipullorum TaxID=2755040 RepID=A0ABS8CD32_9BURK|nr:Wzz/FepE/Etk N-terminal domain-containing protein [Mesopusillimonas faecipullorum]MCB5363951.1 hypothetical protein [Mesopusillimonas faecipullorum]